MGKKVYINCSCSILKKNKEIAIVVLKNDQKTYKWNEYKL